MRRKLTGSVLSENENGRDDNGSIVDPYFSGCGGDIQDDDINEVYGAAPSAVATPSVAKPHLLPALFFDTLGNNPHAKNSTTRKAGYNGMANISDMFARQMENDSCVAKRAAELRNAEEPRQEKLESKRSRGGR